MSVGLHKVLEGGGVLPLWLSVSATFDDDYSYQLSDPFEIGAIMWNKWNLAPFSGSIQPNRKIPIK